MKLQKKQKWAKIAAASVFAGVTGLSAAIYAATLADTAIKNLASVDYFDENGNDYSATSNEAEVRVASVFSATLAQDQQNETVAPGGTEYISHTLTNTGNDTDSYDITVDWDPSTLLNAYSGDGDPSTDEVTITVFLDSDGNGEPSAGEPVLTTTTYDGDDNASVVGPAFTQSVPAANPLTGATGFVNLVVAISVPTNATNGEDLGAVLNVTSSNTTVDDISAGNGADNLDGTNQDRVTVSTGPVLVTNKDSSINAAATQITYTLSVTNNGAATTDVVIFDSIPDGTTFNSVTSVSGLLATNGDQHYVDGVGYTTIDISAIAVTDDFGEEAGVDMDGNGVAGEAAGSAGLNFIALRDVAMGQNETRTVTYVVDIAPTFRDGSTVGAGAQINNIFCATDGTVTDCSNQRTDIIPQVYGVDADDTDGDGDLTPADGTDDPGTTPAIGDDEDGFDDDTQFVNQASAGSTVDLRNVITNNGNGGDIFDLEIAPNHNFPDGTTFSFWDSTGSVLLTNNTGDGRPDTGLLGPGASVTITVRATLPSVIPATTQAGTPIVSANNSFFIDVASGGNTANVWDGGNGSDNDYATAADNERFTATIIVTSDGDPSVSDTKTESLGVIVDAGADIANATLASAVVSVPGDVTIPTAEANFASTSAEAIDIAANLFDSTINVHGDDANPATGFGTIDSNDVTNNYTADVGETFKIDLAVANESGSSQAYLLSVAGIPAGWDVTFENYAGTQISATPSIPGGSVFGYRAVVVVSPDAAEAVLNTNYDLNFSVTGTSNGVTDNVVDRVTINAVCSVSVIPTGLQQVQPGGTVNFAHTLANNSNFAQDFAISSYFTAPGTTTEDSWSTRAQVTETGNGLQDFSSLVIGDFVDVLDANGAVKSVALVDADGAGLVGVPLLPGEQINFVNLVFAASNASDGSSKVSIVSVDAYDPNNGNANTCGTSTATDTAEVILGQVRLDKKVAIDNNCDCLADTPFLDIQTAKVAPNECIIWQLTATNDGDADATNVTIRDAVTSFSDIAVAGVDGVAATAEPLKLCHSSNDDGALCASTGLANTDAVTAGIDGDAGEVDLAVDPATVIFAAGDTDTANATGTDIPTISLVGGVRQGNGTLIPGDSSVAEFCVKVN